MQELLVVLDRSEWKYLVRAVCVCVCGWKLFIYGLSIS